MKNDDYYFYSKVRNVYIIKIPNQIMNYQKACIIEGGPFLRHKFWLWDCDLQIIYIYTYYVSTKNLFIINNHVK